MAYIEFDGRLDDEDEKSRGFVEFTGKLDIERANIRQDAEMDPRRVDAPAPSNFSFDQLKKGASDLIGLVTPKEKKSVLEGAPAPASEDLMLRPEYIEKVREQMAAIPVEDQLNYLRATAENDKTVYGRAAKVLLARAEVENAKVTPEGRLEARELLKSEPVAPRPRKTGTLSLPPKASFPNAEPNMLEAYDGVTRQDVAQESLTAAGLSDAREKAKTDTEVGFDGYLREKAAQNSPNLAALTSGVASTLAGTINAPAVAADAFNKTVVDPLLGMIGMAPLPKVSTMPGTESLTKMASEYMPKVANMGLDEAWKSDNFGLWLTTNLAANVPQMAQSMIAMYAAPLRSMLLPAMGAQAAGSSYVEGDDSRVALAKGGVEIVTEMLPLAAFDKIGKAIAGLTLPSQKAVLAVAGQKLLGAGASITVNSVTNAIEETAAQFGGNALDKYVAGKDIELTKDVGKSALIGALSGGTMSMPQSAAMLATPGSRESAAARGLSDVIDSANFTQAGVNTDASELIRTGSVTGQIRPDATALPGQNPKALDFERSRLEQLRATAFTPEETATAVTDPGIESIDEAIYTAQATVDQTNKAANADAILTRVDLAQTLPSVFDNPTTPSAEPTLPTAGTLPGVEPVTIWTGRKGDGYDTQDAAKSGLNTVTKANPSLDWKIEPMASGKFRVAGYERAQAGPVQRVTEIPDNAALSDFVNQQVADAPVEAPISNRTFPDSGQNPAQNAAPITPGVSPARDFRLTPLSQRTNVAYTGALAGGQNATDSQVPSQPDAKDAGASVAGAGDSLDARVAAGATALDAASKPTVREMREHARSVAALGSALGDGRVAYVGSWSLRDAQAQGADPALDQASKASEFAAAVAKKAFGTAPIPVTGLGHLGAAYSGKTFIDVEELASFAKKSGNSAAMVAFQSIGHESTHILEKSADPVDRDAYDKFRAVVLQYAKPGALERRAKYEGVDAADPLAASELTADVSGNMWTDHKFWGALYDVDNGSTFRRVIYSFMQAATKFIGAAKGFRMNNENLLTDVEPVRRAAAEMWAKRAAGKSPPSEISDVVQYSQQDDGSSSDYMDGMKGAIDADSRGRELDRLQRGLSERAKAGRNNSDQMDRGPVARLTPLAQSSQSSPPSPGDDQVAPEVMQAAMSLLGYSSPQYSRGVIAEVAPNPDQPIADEWRQMTPAEKVKATTHVSGKIVERITGRMGLKGWTHRVSTGTYQKETNPNFIVEAPADATPEQIDEVARTLGHVLDQKAMVTFDEDNTSSESQSGFVKVVLPAGMSTEKADALRKWIADKVPEADGDTLRDGALVFGNFTQYSDNPVSDADYHTKIKQAAAEFGWDGGTIEVLNPKRHHSGYIQPENRDGYLEGTRYGKGDKQGSEARGDDLRGRQGGGDLEFLRGISQEAIGLRDGWINARANREPKRAGPAQDSGSEREYGTAREGSASAVGYHFSKQRRSLLSSGYFGTGLRGLEGERLSDPANRDIKPRLNFYVDKGKGVHPEPGVGGSRHTVKLNNLYDLNKDPDGIAKNNRGADPAQRASNLERAVMKAGYDGYLTDNGGNQAFAVLIGKHDIEMPAADKKSDINYSVNEDGEWVMDEEVDDYGDEVIEDSPKKTSFRADGYPISGKGLPTFMDGNKIITPQGDPMVWYHGTARDIEAFKTKQADAVFLSPQPSFAGEFAAMSMDWMVEHYDQVLTPEQIAQAKENTIKAINADKLQSKSDRAVLVKMVKNGNIVGEAQDYFDKEARELLPSGANVMPLIARATNPFDYQNPQQVQELIFTLQDRQGVDDVEITPVGGKLKALSPDDLEMAIRSGIWSYIEAKEVQDALRNELGHDAFYVKEMGVKNLAVYDPRAVKSLTGNNGNFSLDDERVNFSLAQGEVPLSTAKLMDMSDEKARTTLGLTAAKSGRQANNVRKIGEALNAAAKRAGWGFGRAVFSDDGADIISSAMASEVRWQLKATHSNGTGLGWYSSNYPKAVKALSRRFPELADNADARAIFTALVAVTSNGEKVEPNIKLAIKLYSDFRDGKPLVSAGTRRATALENNLAQIEALIEQFGISGMRAELLKETTVAKMNAELRARGEKSDGSYTADTIVPQAAVYFGPKLGAFYANLMGSEGYLTMDLWWSRTFNRMRGVLVPRATESAIKTLRSLIGDESLTDSQVIAASEDIGKRYKEYNFITELEYLVGTKQSKFPGGKAAWEARAKEVSGDAFEFMLHEHKTEKAANNVYKPEFLELEEAPFNASDRNFMVRVARMAQDKLRKRGVDLSLADVQAALWYYEKRLYQKLSGRKADDIGYEEAIIRQAHASGGRERPSVRFSGQRKGRNDAAGASPVESGVLPSAEQQRKAGRAGEEVSLSRAQSPLGLYSALSDSVEKLNYKALPPSGWTDALKGLVNKGQIKADEVEWSGINEWLGLQTSKVSKDSVLAYLGANGVQVQEVVLGDDPGLDQWIPEDSDEEYGPAPESPTKYEEYQLPGGKNYREVLLTLPESGVPYKSPHWSQKNVLAHLRVNDRTDADGSKVLFIEELQSDWGQAVKKDGFKGGWDVSRLKAESRAADQARTDARLRMDVMAASMERPMYTGATAERKAELDAKFRELLIAYNETLAPAMSATAALQNAEAANKVAVPRAPFVDKTDKWLTLALKRVVTMAAQGGYDKVAFVNGEQSADRYDLSKQVDELHWARNDGKYTLKARKRGDTGYIDIANDIAESALSDYVGKDVAQKIVDQRGKKWRGTMSGLDLKVGGEGMRTFYDSIVPNAAKALLKKLGGGQMESVKFREDRGFEDSYQRSKGMVIPPITQPGFTLTPEMKSKVEEGLPMFSRAQTETPEFKRWFGDSKVVDANGNPLVVYHGTAEFDGGVFKGSLSFFTAKPSFANGFAALKSRGSGGMVIPAFLSIKKPFDVRNYSSDDAVKDAVDDYVNDLKQQGEDEARINRMQSAVKRGEWAAVEDLWRGVDLEAYGFDGLVVKEGESWNYAAFRPGQIKSVFNSGDFSDNPDISLSRAQPRQGVNYMLPGETRLSQQRRLFQDYFLPVLEVQNELLKQGGIVTEASDVYRAEERMYGRVEEALRDFRKTWFDPMIKKAAKAGLTMDEVSLYAYAKHAKERNAYIGTIRNDMPDSGSGMTNDEADAILAQFAADGKTAKLDDIHSDLMAITATTRRTLLDEGLITQDEYDAYESQYEFYVPLRGFEVVKNDGENVPFRSGGRGFNIRGKETTRALGRRTRAGDLIENIAMDYERAVFRGERNQVAKSFLELIRTNPDPGLWEINKRLTKLSFDKAAGRVAKNTVIDAGADTIAVKIDGKEVYITIKDQRLLRAMRKASKDDTGSIERAINASSGMFLSLIRKSLTQYNPVFAAVNAARDFQSGGVGVLDELGAKGVALYVKHYRASLAAAGRHQSNALGNSGRSIKTLGFSFGDPVMDRYFEEYRAAGGTTGGYYGKTAEDMNREIRTIMLAAGAAPKGWKEQVKTMGGSNVGRNALKGVQAAGNVLEFAGAVSENAARVSAYRAAREMGKSAAEAASIAKNLTTNFNRKGEWGGALNGLFLFFNAAVQGTHRAAVAMKNPKVLGLTGGLTALGATAAMMALSVGGDDEDDGQAYWDKIPAYEKERNLILMLPPGYEMDGLEKVGSNGRYLKIPMPYVYNIFPVIGMNLVDAYRYQKDKTRGLSPAKAAINMMNAAMGSLNPLGGAIDLSSKTSLFQAMSPTVVDIAIQQTQGVDSFDRPTSPYKADTDYHPDSENVNARQAGGIWHMIARKMNSVTGGDRAEPGWIDVNPGTLENAAKQLTGGTGTFLSDLFVNLPTKLYGVYTHNEAEITPRDIPLYRNFYGMVDGVTDSSLLYERRREIQKAATAQKGRAELGLDPKDDTNQAALAALGSTSSKYTKAMSDIRKEEISLAENEEMSTLEKNVRRKELKALRAEMARDFNKIFMDIMRDERDGAFSN